MAEGARLESVYTFTGIGGSNPSLSAIALDIYVYKGDEKQNGVGTGSLHPVAIEVGCFSVPKAQFSRDFPAGRRAPVPFPGGE